MKIIKLVIRVHTQKIICTTSKGCEIGNAWHILVIYSWWMWHLSSLNHFYSEKGTSYTILYEVPSDFAPLTCGTNYFLSVYTYYKFYNFHNSYLNSLFQSIIYVLKFILAGWCLTLSAPILYNLKIIHSY